MLKTIYERVKNNSIREYDVATNFLIECRDNWHLLSNDEKYTLFYECMMLFNPEQDQILLENLIEYQNILDD